MMLAPRMYIRFDVTGLQKAMTFFRSNTHVSRGPTREDYANVTCVSSRFKLRSTVDARESVVDVSDIRHSGAMRAFRNRFFPRNSPRRHKCNNHRQSNDHLTRIRVSLCARVSRTVTA